MKIYRKKHFSLLSYAVLLLVAVTGFGFSLKKVNPMLLDGEVRKTINMKGGKAILDCSYELFSYHYHITLHLYLYGRKFSVNPSFLPIVASNPDIMIVPACRADKNCGESVQINSSYSIPTFRKITYVSHEFDVTFKSTMNFDSVSLYIPPSDYLIYDGRPVISDTIRLEVRNK